jgi:putative membrane protein
MRQTSRWSMAVAAIALAACSSSKDTNRMDSTSTATSSTTTTVAGDSARRDSTATGGAMSDANIMAKEIAADSGEVALAMYVRSHASDAGVKSYAGELVSDHSKGEKQAKALASKLSITPQPAANDTTSQATEHAMSRFASLKGHDLDTAFVAHEIEDHKSDLDDAHKASSAAQNAEVKQFVEKSIPELQKHLDRAQALDKKLSGKKS